MAPAVKQVFYNGGFSSSITASSGSNITSGNVLVAFQYTNATSNVPANPSGCVTWTQAATNNSTFVAGAATGTWSVGPITSTAACTVTANGTGGNIGLALAVWELSSATTTVDGTPSFQYTSSGGTFNGPSTTTTTSGDMVLAICLWNTGTLAINSPFTSSANGTLFPGAPFPSGDLSYDVQASSGSIHGSYTVSSVSGNFSIMALKAGGVVGGSNTSWLTVNANNSLRGLRH